MDRKPRILASVEPALLKRVRDEATRRYHGRESMVVLVGVELYLELRDLYGARFEIVVEELRERAKTERAA
jgi:hypothetical protein